MCGLSATAELLVCTSLAVDSIYIVAVTTLHLRTAAIMQFTLTQQNHEWDVKPLPILTTRTSLALTVH